MISMERANKSIGYEFGKRPFNPADTYYLGLSTTPIADGAGFTEPPASCGYGRIAITNDSTFWSEPANYAVTNLQKFLFPAFKTDLEDMIVYWFISEKESASIAGDKAEYYGKLRKERPILQDSQIMINAGDMILERRNPPQE